MTRHDREEAARAERARDIALFRYALVREAASSELSTRQRGRLVRTLAESEHVGPAGKRIRVSRATIDRWIRDWRAGGFDALVPEPRRVAPRTDADVLALAMALKKEAPGRTAAQVGAVLRAHNGFAPSERTLQRHFAGAGLNVRPDGSTPATFGRFEADRPNELWVGDALHGPIVTGKKAILFAFLDDHSRAVVGHRWTHAEDTLRGQAALRSGLTARGLPKIIYLDNGAPFAAKELARTCAVLGVRLTHSQPRRPQGRGKIERFFRTVREQFLVEWNAPGRAGDDDLVALNTAFTAWVETVYHRRAHSETGQPPIERFLSAGPPTPVDPALLAEAFRWSAWRTVTTTATVSLWGNVFEVDPALAGRKIECVFDPFDLTAIEVRYHGRSMGAGIPHKISRHSHPKARPELAPPAGPTGIDYLKLIADRHAGQLANRLRYAGFDETAGDRRPDLDDASAEPEEEDDE
jgi:putative transposase